MIAVSSRSYSHSLQVLLQQWRLVPDFLFLLRLHRLHRLHRLNWLNGLWRRGDAQRDAASGRGQLGRQLGLRHLRYLRHLRHLRHLQLRRLRLRHLRHLRHLRLCRRGLRCLGLRG